MILFYHFIIDIVALFNACGGGAGPRGVPEQRPEAGLGCHSLKCLLPS